MLTALVASLLALAPALGEGEGARPPDLAFSPRRWALVIGADDYEELGHLRYARADARAFAGALEEHLGFERESIRLLTDDADEPELRPTAGHVLRELERLLRDPRRTSSDLFVFYFCGHGAGLPSGDYLLPTDATDETAERVGLAVKEVVGRLAQAGMQNVLVLVDACREGAAHPFGSELQALAEQTRLGVVLGCAPGAQSHEYARLQHGVFTAKLLAELADRSNRDEASGALWFSKVVQAAGAAVSAYTAKEKPPQQPAVWSDPARDVLLSAAPPQAFTAEAVAAFQRSAQGLEPEAHAAALARYAEALQADGRAEDCVEVLKTAEQLAPLAPPSAFLAYSSLLDLGRTAEAARVLAELRAREPGTLHALVATVVDQSGAVADTERSLAARELWQGGVQVTLDILILMMQAHLRAGANAEALEIAQSALAQAPEDTSDAAFLAAVVAYISGDLARAAQEYERAESLPGALFDRQLLRFERFNTLKLAGLRDETLALLARCIAEWPESGRWLAERAWYVAKSASSAADLDRAFADAQAALARELQPAQLLLVVRAAGARVTELAAEVTRHAEAHPLSWEAQIAAVMANQPADMRGAVAAAARLAARPALAYATMGRLSLEALYEQSLRQEVLHGPESPEVRAVEAAIKDALRYLLERLTPMAAEFGADPDSWSLLSDLYRRQGEYEAFVRLFERHLGPAIASGHVADELAVVLAPAWLNTGRLERFRACITAVPRGRAATDALVWLEAAYLATRGQDEEARTLLGARTQPMDQSDRALAAPLLALLRARAGDVEHAREALHDVELERDPLALAVHYLALRACGDDAERWLERISDVTPLDGLFAFEACVRARPGGDPREPALLALHFPYNPLLAQASFLAEPSLEAFAGAQQYALEQAEGPLGAQGGTLTLTTLASGKVIGALVLGESDGLVVQGRVDERGNLEGEIVGGAEPCTLLAKLVPRRAFDEYEPLAEGLQPFTLFTAEGLPFEWLGRLVR